VDTAGTDYTANVTGGTLVTIARDGDATTLSSCLRHVPAEVGDEDLTLTYSSAADRYDLADTDGTVTGFTKPVGSTDGVYGVERVAAGDPSSTTYAYETVAGDQVTASWPAAARPDVHDGNRTWRAAAASLTYAPAARRSGGHGGDVGDYPAG